MPATTFNKRTGVNEHLQSVMDFAKKEQSPRQLTNAACAQNVSRSLQARKMKMEKRKDNTQNDQKANSFQLKKW
jgi:hypothetical protein